MTPGHRPSRRLRLLAIACAGGIAVAATALLGGFHTELHPVTPDEPGATRSELVTTEVVGIRTFSRPDGISVATDVVYGTQSDGALLTLDVCSPTGDTEAGAPRSAVVSIHGGSWARGDKGNSDWRAVCTWLASEGFVAYSVNYRLVPDALFPAAIDDLGLAVEWIRQADNAARYGIDPDRIGAFGGSAGGNLAALLGARGSGSLTEGARVAAVAELSGPTDLGHEALVVGNAPAGLQRIVQSYLGCASLADCPQARAASPLSELDRSDPPVFIGAAAEEFIPLAQSIDYVSRLDRLGIPNELVTVPGTLHSIGILDATMRVKVAAFLHRHLVAP
ncbi:alpha/beta hydrolase [Cryobacterium tagatosivorans]|uniref:alpha/beta hydrolase n=1 Tax=Cryobacterium tagatosivorans TaxID=1259199 RepID=UPI00141B44C1|nr:alpha/beta hydrolase [Cryobacterium tagatosivorans]